MKIFEQQYFLALKYEPNQDLHEIALFEGASDAIGGISGYIRHSPVWLCDRNDNSDEDGQIGFEQCIAVAFLSYTNPEYFFGSIGAVADKVFPGGRFLTGLGAFNIVLMLHNEDAMDAVRRYSKENKKSVEIWKLAASKKGLKYRSVDAFEYIEQVQPGSPGVSLEGLPQLLSEKNEAYHPITFELATLLHTGYNRSRTQSSAIHRDIWKLSERVVDKYGNDDLLKDIDNYTDGERSVILSNLHNINAGLSRMNSQAFCGVTPIHKSEGHFGPHSFLGIGLASMALRNLVGFISQVNENNSLSAKISTLLRTSEQSIADSHFDGAADLVDASFEILRPVYLLDKIPASEPSETWTPITYFSGRDGFKNSEYTTSAPLMSISAANSRAWSLITITHEVSHRIFSSVVGHVMIMLAEEEISAKTLNELEASGSSPNRLMADVFLECIYFTLVGLAEEYNKLSKRTPEHRDDSNFFVLLMHEYFEEVEELFVHLFDFWYFYDRDTSQYLKSIWSSWAVIPEIETRLDEYVLRSIVAISAKNVGRENWLENSINEFRLEFEHGSLKDGFFLKDEILATLDDQYEIGEIGKAIDRRKHLVKLFHLFFKGAGLAGDFKDDELHGRTGDGKKGYSYTPNKFELGKFENPIRLIEYYARDEQPNASKSMWMMQILALNWSPPKAGG